MDVLIILFVFLFPMVSIIVSMYCLFYIFALKRGFSKLSVLQHSSGKDDSHE